MALPKHLTPEKMARVALTAILRTPKLLSCSQESLLESMMILSQVGLPPDGRVSHLIPFGDKCTVIIDWKGYVELARRNGVVVTSQLVCQNDVFTVQQDDGTGTSKVNHAIDYTKPRGPEYAVYSRAKLPNGEVDYEIMTKEEVEYVRNTFSRGKDADAWRKSWGEMARKTVIRRHAKRWPLDAEVAQALEVENEESRDVTPVKPLFPEIPAAPSEPATEAPLTNGNAGGTNMADGSHELRAMPGLCKLSGIEESDVIAYLHATGVDDSLTTLADIDRMAHKALAYVHEHWSEVAANIKNALAAEAKKGATLL